jgi:hypothetical protein
MKKILFSLIYSGLLVGGLMAQEGWRGALRKMPLSPDTLLNRDNCLPLLLGAFQSNEVVKALVFLPAVSDDFYLLSRDRPKLDIKSDNLLDAIIALTNATPVRATFKAPLLLLHLDRDGLEFKMVISHRLTAKRLDQQCSFPNAVWIDWHWERLQPELQAALRMKVLPDGPSVDAWHFARHNMAAWNLSDWELLAALSLTGKTSISVERNRLVFGLREAP